METLKYKLDIEDTGESFIFKKRCEYGECKIIVTNNNVWTISSWQILDKYQHKGIGKNLLCSLVEEILFLCHEPSLIQYIWNGQNDYVLNWLKRFDAKCLTEENVLKNNADDDWDSHIYVLNKEKFLNYCTGKE